MYQQVWILAVSQALFQTVSVLVATVGALAGFQIASTPGFATLPIAAMFLGTAAATVPASMFMSRAGRRAGFLTGAGLGAAGGVLAAGGVFTASLWLLCAGTFLVGVYQGFAQFFRFAASEVADEDYRPRAIGYVLAGGVVASIAGPKLGVWGGTLLEPSYTASFLIAGAVSLVGMGTLMFLNIPGADTGPHAEAKEARPLFQIFMQPTYLVALFSAASGYGIMILAMTATPLAMGHHGHGDGVTATVIQLHVLGMFLPSFFTGSLISCFGVRPVMLAGVFFFLLHVWFTFSGTDFYSFAGALILLGVGWNFLYIGGTSLLTKAYAPSEKSKAQAMNDLIIFAVGLACSASAGFMQASLGWQTLNLVLLPWIGLTGLSILFHSRQESIGKRKAQ
ncbi:MFS transporter [Leisingera sp. ANG-Vp]|nr:MFS transporter [Leisingera sp. ANG-Vp]